MLGLREIIARTQALFRSGGREREMAEEMRMHLDHLTGENLEKGMAPDEARFAARRRFGGVDQFQEQCRDATGWRGIERTLRDVRFGARALRKSPGFTLVALLTVALCIGANTAIFSVVYALLLKPLPFPQPGRIVEIYNVFPKAGLPKEPCSIIQYLEYKQQTAAYAAVGLWGSSVVTLGPEGSADRVTAASCTADMFAVLGLQPVLGRFFSLENDRPGEDKEVVLTQSFWESHFAEDPAAIGKTLRIDGEAYRIVGVAPRAAQAFDPHAQFIRPRAWSPHDVSEFARFYLNTPLFARLTGEGALTAARVGAAAVERRYYDVAPANMKTFLDNSGHGMAIVPMQAERTRPVVPALLLLQGAAAFVLLVGCVNLANLLLARTNSRQHEIAIRSALGAGRATIVFHFLTEYLLLNIMGIALGFGLAFGGLPLANHFLAKTMPNALPVRLDAGALALVTGIFVILGLAIGSGPVLCVLRHRTSGGLQRISREGPGRVSTRILSGVLITGQIAAALVLLTGAGLLVHSFAKAIAVDPGFDPNQVIVVNLAIPGSQRTDANWGPFTDQLLESLQEISGVESAALATAVPFQGTDNSNPFTVKDDARPPGAPQAVAQFLSVSPGYFRTLRIPIVAGRFFGASDLSAGRNAHVVDEHFARKYFPGRSTVGGRFSYDRPPGAPPERDSEVPVIVGEVGWVPQNGVEDRSDNPFVYYPIKLKPQNDLSAFVRSARAPGDLMAEVRKKIRTIDPTIAVLDGTTLRAAVDSSYENRKAITAVLGAFAALALFLSGIGIYGVLAYDVSLRTREMGIRGAIGATQRQIVGLVMRQAVGKIALGSVIGLVSAVLLSRYMVALLYQVTPTDPSAYAAVSILLIAVALLGSYLPARRAARIDPLQALRDE